MFLNWDITSTCYSFNSFGNKGFYCKAMSGNEYNTAGDTGMRGGGEQDGWLCLSPCSVIFFFPYFHRKTKQKQQQKSRGFFGTKIFQVF